MMLKNILLVMALLVSSSVAAEFIDYKKLSSQLKKEHKIAGTYATTEDVKNAIKAKDWAIVDVRTNIEWAGAHIKGTQRIGRQAGEKALENIVLDDDDKMIKDKLIVVCNSAARASIEAETFKRMGFSKVMIYDIYSWIDECNPVVTNYTVKLDKAGTGLKFGMFKAEHCK